MVQLSDERDVDTLRQISLLLDRENQRLIEKVRQLTVELARVRGVPNADQLELALLQELRQARDQVLRPAARSTDASSTSTPRPGHPGFGPRHQAALPTVEIRHELPPDRRACPACGGELAEMTGQAETSERVTTVKLTYQVEQHVRQKYRCSCNGAVVTAPAPPTLIPGGRYTPAFAVGVAVAKYADHLPLAPERGQAEGRETVHLGTTWCGAGRCSPGSRPPGRISETLAGRRWCRTSNARL